MPGPGTLSVDWRPWSRVPRTPGAFDRRIRRTPSPTRSPTEASSAGSQSPGEYEILTAARASLAESIRSHCINTDSLTAGWRTKADLIHRWDTARPARAVSSRHGDRLAPATKRSPTMNWARYGRSDDERMGCSIVTRPAIVVGLEDWRRWVLRRAGLRAHRAQLRQQSQQVEGLHHELREAGRKSSAPIARFAVRGDGHQGHATLRSRQGAHAGGELVPVPARHLEVRQHDMRPPRGDEAECLRG